MSTLTVHSISFRRLVPIAVIFLVLTACATEDNRTGDAQNYAGAGAGFGGYGGVAGMYFDGAGGVAGMAGGGAGTAGMAGGGAGTAGMAGGGAGNAAVGGEAAGMGGMAGTLAGAGGVAGNTVAGAGGAAGVAAAGSSGAGAGGSGGAGGAAGAAGSTPTGLIPQRCTGDGSTVAMIGDSYWALSGEIYMFLQQYSGQNYRAHYVSATLIGQIQQQALDAYAEAPTETLLMDGGGNDALLNTSCTVGGLSNATCKASVDAALQVPDEMYAQAVAAGVKEIIYFYYPHIVTFGAQLNPINDYAYPIARDKCESRTDLDCTFIETKSVFDGHPEYLGFDGIHPSTSGSEAIAQLVWAVMEENCANGLSVTQ